MKKNKPTETIRRVGKTASVRIRKTRRGFIASICWTNNMDFATSVLGEYPSEDKALAAAATVINTADVPRLNTPADITKTRRELMEINPGVFSWRT